MQLRQEAVPDTDREGDEIKERIMWSGRRPPPFVTITEDVVCLSDITMFTGGSDIYTIIAERVRES
jgi:hypothetical protein